MAKSTKKGAKKGVKDLEVKAEKGMAVKGGPTAVETPRKTGSY